MYMMAGSDSPICRICMAAKESFLSIEDPTENNEPVLHEMISECTRYQVELNDTLPKKVCMSCAEDIRTAYRLKIRAEESYRKLCELYKKEIGNSSIHEKGTQTEKHIYSCEHCLMKFYDRGDLQAHRKTEHQGVERICRFCKKSFDLLRQLKSHLIQEHPDQYVETNLQCNICERKFSRRDHLQRHMRNIHKIERKSSSLNSHAISQDTSIEHPIDCIEMINKSEWNDENDDSCPKNPIMSDSECDAGNEGKDISFDSIFDKNIKEEPENDVKETKAENVHNSENVIVKVEVPNYDSDKDYEPEDVDFAHSNHDDDDDDENSDMELPVKTKASAKDHISKTIKSKKKRVKKESSELRENRCELCQRVFSRQCHLRRHMQSAHSNEKPHACPHCEKRFTRSDHLKMHVVNVHEIKSHKCDMCEKAFVKIEALKRHKEVRHGDASGVYKIHECEFCKRKFTGKRYLARHRLLHTDRIFACRFCEETFKDRKLFREHERQHSSTQRNFLCSICGESFVRNDYLRVHMRRHLGEKPYKCQYCDKGFPRATDVKVHERYHTGTKPNVCTICGKAFHRAYNLTIHMRIHTGEKPYKCDHCSKCFAQSNDLKAHVRRHTGERFKCQECDASFLQLYGLRQHALSAHGTHIESSTGRLQKVGCLGGQNSIEVIRIKTATNTASTNVTSQQASPESTINNLSGPNSVTSAHQSDLIQIDQQPIIPTLLHQQMQHSLPVSFPLIYPNVPPIDGFKNQHFTQMK